MNIRYPIYEGVYRILTSEGMPHDGYGTNGYGILLNPIKEK